MSMKVYPADKVDALLRTASNAMRGMKEYAAGLLAKQAASEKIILEKVASQATASNERVANFVDTLIGLSIIPEHSREKYASAIKSSPDAALEIAIQALKLSESPVTQGRGIKSASGRSAADQDRLDEDALWSKAVAVGKWD